MSDAATVRGAHSSNQGEPVMQKIIVGTLSVAMIACLTVYAQSRIAAPVEKGQAREGEGSAALPRSAVRR